MSFLVFMVYSIELAYDYIVPIYKSQPIWVVKISH